MFRSPPAETPTASTEAAPATAEIAAADWNALNTQIGKYPNETKLLEDSAITADLKTLLGDKFDAFKQGKGHEGVIDPAALAETYWHLAHQPRNCWSHEVDVRPWTDTPWWNDNPDPQIDSKGKGFAGPRTD